MDRLTKQKDRWQVVKSDLMKIGNADYESQHAMSEAWTNYILKLEELKAENEVLKMSKNALESDLVNATMNLDNLSEITAGILLDRLKEICEAVRLIGQEVYEVIGNRIETYTVTNIGVEEECVSVNIERPVHDGMIEDGFEIGDEDIHNIFHGDNAKERAEARLKEITG